MKFMRLIALCLAASAAQAQGRAQDKARDCQHTEMSSRRLHQWIHEAHNPTELNQISCYLRVEAMRLRQSATEEDVKLHAAYANHVGGSKYPSAADHARAFHAVYEAKASKYSALASELDLRAIQDSSAH